MPAISVQPGCWNVCARSLRFARLLETTTTIELQASLPVARVFQAGPHRIGSDARAHADYRRKRQTARSSTLEQMRGHVDCAVYGHSHKPEDTMRDGLRMVNPGSATWPRWEPQPSYAIA